MTKDEYLKYFDETYRERLTAHPVFADRYNGFRKIFETLLNEGRRTSLSGNKEGFTIVETGTLRKKDQWTDGQSSLLFFEFLSFFGGELVSIDTDRFALETCEEVLRDTVGLDKAKLTTICGDSVAELEKIDRPVDLFYLDSYDLDPINPFPSMAHHLKELASVGRIRAKSPGLIVAVDDNFEGGGKGTLVREWALTIGKEIIHDGLQFICRLW